MITFEEVSFTYPGRPCPTLRQVDGHLEEGALGLVIGPTGSGKTTLLRMVNGSVPRFTGGRLGGRVRVGGLLTSDHDLASFADLVGFVAQDPGTGFVTTTVEEELAYTMEQLGVDPQVMRKRVEETLDLLGLHPLRSRRLKDLSGGEAQRVAIGAVLTAHPRVMVLDEPTSSLDPAAAEEVLAILTRLVHDLGITVLLAEHRLERVVQYADTVFEVTSAGGVHQQTPAAAMRTASLAPPVVHLGRLAGWDPLPLSVRDARRQAAHLALASPPPVSGGSVGPLALTAERIGVDYGEVTAVAEVDLRLHQGEVTALMGRNGAGKSSLLWALQGSGPRSRGRVTVDGVDPAGLHPPAARRLVALVPDNPGDLLFMESVADECARADDIAGAPRGTTLRLAERMIAGLDPRAHPADLSEGQKLTLALAIQLAAGARVVLLDEPTRGLDYTAKAQFGRLLGELREDAAVLIATHDVEFVAEVADRVVVMADGEIVADGATAAVVTSSPIFAPQVAKVLAPRPWLTPTQVAAALGRP